MQLEDRRFGTGYKSYMGFARLGADVVDLGVSGDMVHNHFQNDTVVAGGMSIAHGVAAGTYGITAWAQAFNNGGTPHDAKRNGVMALGELLTAGGYALAAAGQGSVALAPILGGVLTTTLAQGA